MIQKRMRGVIAYLNTGNGFKSPAVAIGKALEARGVEVECVDVLDHIGEHRADTFMRKGWEFYLRHPWTFAITFFLGDTFLVHIAQRLFARTVWKSIARYLHREQPDFILSTHFVITEALDFTLKRRPMPIAFFGYNSDVILSHQAYIAKGVHRYLIATEQGRQGMIRQGMEPDQVIRSSFPLDPKFKKEFGSVPEERARLGLDDAFTVLITFGGMGIGSYGLVERIAASGLPVQIVAICGRSAEAMEAMEAIKLRYPQASIDPRGFVTNMQDYLYCCDISAGKSGLNMVFESIYMHKPFLALMAMANERFAAEFVVEHGYGWYPDDEDETVAIIERAVHDPEFTRPIVARLQERPVDYDTAELATTIERETIGYKRAHLGAKRALFFDLAGTLCDIPIGGVWEDVNIGGIAKVFRELGLDEERSPSEFDQLCAEFVSRKATLRAEAKSTLKEFEIKAQIRDFLRSKELETRGTDWDRLESLFVSTELEITVPFEGASEIVSALSAGYELYLLSNNASTLLVWQIVDKIGVRSCFRDVFVSADVGVRKPDERFLNWVLERTGISPVDAVMIGDRLTQDTLMANDADMASVYCAMVEHADNVGGEKTPLTWRVDSLSELLDVFPRREKPQ